MIRPRCAALFVSFASCLLIACAEGSGGVTRMADGVRYEGRFVNPEAYAAYLLGVEHEAHGDYASALEAYQEAHTEDPDSPEIWARIGAVRCISGKAGRAPGGASSAFEHGIANDPEYFGNYLERARCAERSGDLESALRDASAAVARRPDDEPSNLLVARLLQAHGQAQEARAWLEAYQSYHPTSLAITRALESARKGGSAARAADPTSLTSSAFTELQAGHAERARQRAQIELAADPTNADAWIATLVACDALHDEACFEQALGSLKAPSLAPSPTGIGYLRELLARRTGASAAF